MLEAYLVVVSLVKACGIVTVNGVVAADKLSLRVTRSLPAGTALDKVTVPVTLKQQATHQNRQNGDKQ
jgi:hypothetical protein